MNVEVKVTLTPSEKGALKVLANTKCDNIQCTQCPFIDGYSCLRYKFIHTWKTLYPNENYRL